MPSFILVAVRIYLIGGWSTSAGYLILLVKGTQVAATYVPSFHYLLVCVIVG